MQGIINLNETISEFEGLIPANHFLKKVNQSIDFSFANKLIESLYSPNRGRPVLLPIVFP